MATDVTLYFGIEPHLEDYSLTDPAEWGAVRSQIVSAVNAGKGLITIPRKSGGEVVYVYSPTLPVSWVDKSR